MRCPNCDTQLSAKATFCDTCGERILRSDTSDNLDKGDEVLTDYDTEQESRQTHRKRVIIGVIGSVIALGIIIAILSWYLSPMQRIRRYLDKNDFATAIDWAEELSPVQKRNLAPLLLEKGKAIYTSYNNGNMDFAQADTALEKLSALYNFSELQLVQSDLETLAASKQHYQDAQLQEDKVAAIQHYRMVIEEDTNYSSAQEKKAELLESYKQEILNEAAVLEESEDLQAAISLLKESQRVLSEDSDIEEKLTYISNLLTEKIAQEALATALTYAEDGNYKEAIATLNAVTVVHKDITEKLAEYRSAYRSTFLNEAKKYAAASDYIEAVACLNRGVAELGSDSEIEQLIAEYKAKYPVHLVDLEPCTGENYAKEIRSANIYGNESERGLRFHPEGSYLSRTTEYTANQKYKRFRTTILITSGSSDGTEAYVKIYADDRLIYNSGKLTKKSRPVNIDLDITGVTFVRFEISGTTGSRYSTYGYLVLDDPLFLS